MLEALTSTSRPLMPPTPNRGMRGVPLLLPRLLRCLGDPPLLRLLRVPLCRLHVLRHTDKTNRDIFTLIPATSNGPSADHSDAAVHPTMTCRSAPGLKPSSPPPTACGLWLHWCSTTLRAALSLTPSSTLRLAPGIRHRNHLPGWFLDARATLGIRGPSLWPRHAWRPTLRTWRTLHTLTPTLRLTGVRVASVPSRGAHALSQRTGRVRVRSARR